MAFMVDIWKCTFLRLQMVKLFHIFRFPGNDWEEFSGASKWFFGALSSKNEGCIFSAAVGRITTEHDSFLEPGFTTVKPQFHIFVKIRHIHVN